MHRLPVCGRIGSSSQRKVAADQQPRRVFILEPVEYVRPASLDQALLALGNRSAKVLAGGQSLIPVMRLGLARPSLLVDISRLELAYANVAHKLVRIGALLTWHELATTQTLNCPGLEALQECAQEIGDSQVRNIGTVGGGVAHGDPSADFAAAMLAFDADFRLRATSRERVVRARDFFRGPFATALEPEEILCEIEIAQPPQHSGSAYVSVKHPASGYPVVGAAAFTVLLRDGSGSCRVGLTGLSGAPVSISASAEDTDAVAAAVLAEASSCDVIGDLYAPEPYRRHLIGIVTKRALEYAFARAQGNSL